MRISLLISALFFSAMSQAKLVTTSLKLDIMRPSEPQAMSLKGYKKKFNNQLIKIEKKQYTSCVNTKKIPKDTPDRLKVWWTYLLVKCSRKKYKSSEKIRSFISNHIDQIYNYQGDLSYLGSHLGSILVALSQSKKYIISEHEKNFLVMTEDYLKKSDRAKFYSFLGLRFEKEKKPKLSAEYYFKAYDTSQLSMYATRLKTLLNANQALIPTYQDFYASYKVGSNEGNKKENYRSFHNTRGSFAKVKEGVRLLNKYESTSYKVISKIYRLVKSRTKPKFNSKWAKAIKKCHNKCLVKFAERVYQAHNYDLSYAVAESAFAMSESGRAKIVMGLSALQRGQHKTALSDYKEARKQSVFKSKDYFEATFRLGLVLYRMKEYKKAIEVLDNHEAHKEVNNFNLQTTYWLWRAMQKVKHSKTKLVQNRLIKLYPLTYYGLLANYEKNGEKLILPTNIHVFQKDMKWSPKQVVSWENYKDFLQMQFYGLARKELKILFNKNNDQEAVLYSHFSALAADHFAAIKTMNIIWDKNPYVNFTKNTTKLTLPTEYNTIVNTYSDKYEIERNLVRSLIKQESSYRLRAVSGSNAMGLMQLVPITIKDSAGYLKINKKSARAKIFEPEMNVRMGTSYLYRMVNAFKGHIPLALAAYNAGIGNIRRWIKKRPEDLAHLQEKGSSHVDDEIWIDELPWAETSFYVKAILRNLVLYRFYYDGVNKVPKPVWQLDVPVTASN